FSGKASAEAKRRAAFRATTCWTGADAWRLWRTAGKVTGTPAGPTAGMAGGLPESRFYGQDKQHTRRNAEHSRPSLKEWLFASQTHVSSRQGTDRKSTRLNS